MSCVEPRSRIAILRQQAKLTQLELSQMVGVTETTIANWEKGRSGLEWFERLIRLCWALSCSADDLIEYVPQSSAKGVEAEGLSFAEIRKLMGLDGSLQLEHFEAKGLSFAEIRELTGFDQSLKPKHEEITSARLSIPKSMDHEHEKST